LSLGAQDADGVVCGALPVDPEVVGVGVEKGEAGVVDGADRFAVERGVQRVRRK
jgi:hypothetical protein